MTPLEHFAKVMDMVEESLRKLPVKNESEKIGEQEQPAVETSEQQDESS